MYVYSSKLHISFMILEHGPSISHFHCQHIHFFNGFTKHRVKWNIEIEKMSFVSFSIIYVSNTISSTGAHKIFQM